jgi:hypothetical protein
MWIFFYPTGPLQRTYKQLIEYALRGRDVRESSALIIRAVEIIATASFSAVMYAS